MITNLVKANIKNLQPYNPKEVPCSIKLDANENNNVSHLLNQKISKAILELKINQYPDSNSTEIRKLLSEKLSVSKDQVVVGCGSDQLIFMVLNAFINVGDKILTPSPTFSMYKISNEVVGGETVEVDLDDGFRFNYNKFMMAIKKENPKVIFLSNPNNPTGGIIPREEIIKIVELSNAVVVVDEAYYEFYQNSVVDLVNYYPNLIVLRTLSKAYGLAGARVGYSIASREATAILNKVKPPYNVSSLDQTAAKVCLENNQMIESIITEIVNERIVISNELNKIKDLKVYESYGNFLLIYTEKARDLYQYLISEEILIRYFGDKGDLAGCLRVSIGTKEENARLLYIIKKYFFCKEEQLPLKMAE